MGSASSLLGHASARQLFVALGLAAVGALAALPVHPGPPDPLASLLWLALWAPAAGALAGGLRLPPWPLGWAVPAVWMIQVSLVDALSERDLPTPVWAGLAWTGLFGLGYGIGAVRPAVPARRAALVLAIAALLVALPTGGGLLAEPLPAELAARLLDASPATVLAECASLDWMRHPSVYDPAGTARMDPSLRVGFRGSLAGPVLLVVGFLVAIVGRRWGSSPRDPEGPSP